MSGRGKTEAKKSLASKENKNAKKVISVKRGLRQPKIIKSKLGCKVSNAEIGKKHSKKCYRKKSTKKALGRHTEPQSVSEKSTNRTSERDVVKNVLAKKESGDKKINSRPRPEPQNKIPDKGKSSKSKISIKCPKDANKSGGSNIPIFVRLDNTGDEERYKSKFRKPTSANKLKRLRENLWKKSSYHKRFLGKGSVVKSQKTENSKSETVICKKKRSPLNEGENNFQQSQVKNLTGGNITAEKKNLKLNKPPNEGDSGIKKEEEPNPKTTPLDSNKLSQDDVSTIDERYMKSLLSVTNCGNKPERAEFEYQRKDVCTKATRADNKTKMTGKEFFVTKMKNKKNGLELNLKNDENDSASLESDGKEKTDSAGALWEAIKSEIQIKHSKRKIHDANTWEMKDKAKRAHLKREVDGHEQMKARNVVKNKKQDSAEIPFLCDELKQEEVQELWKRENSSNQRISRSSDSSSTTAGNVSDQNVRTLGMESYEVLKKFVAEEVYRIASKYNKSESPKTVTEKENRGKEISKDHDVSEKQISSSVRKKLAAKSKGNLVQGEKLLRNGETLKTGIPLRGVKVRSLKSKLKLLEERKNQVKKVPDEVIKNWSIVNRLEEAFLTLGTPNFRSGRDPATPNAEKTRAIPKIVPDVKKAEKKIKEKEKNEIKPATRAPFNRQKVDEINKLSEKQLRLIRKMESTSSNRKPGTASSESSAQSAKIEDKTKPQEENVRVQRQAKTLIKPTTKFTNNKSGIKPPTPVEYLCSSWNKILASEQIGKAGKKNSHRTNLCESPTQNKSNNNLERKKTFQVIPLKDTVIVQPRRSQSCNKIDRNSKLDEKCSLQNERMGARNADCKSLTFLSEQNRNFSEVVKEAGESNAEDCKSETKVDVQEAPPDLKRSHSENVGRMSEISGNSSEENVPKVQITADKEEKCVRSPPPREIPGQIKVTNDGNHGSRTRAIKKRSILSIRANQHEYQANISQVEERTPMMFQEDTSDPSKTDDRKETAKVSVFLSPTEFRQTPSTSLSSFDLETSESSPEGSTQKIYNDDELNLLKAASSSKSTQIIASETSYGSKGKSKTRNAPWEEDIVYYRALVKEIMSQYKRLGGFLKHSENGEALQEDLEELTPNEDEVLKEKVSIQEYRKKIMLEYQEVPVLEYKTKMEGIQKKLGQRRKRRNLTVVQPMNGEMDLDVKDYEPEMRVVLNSHIYFDKKTVKKSRELSRNSTEKKFSLQEVNLHGNGKSRNRFPATCATKSFIRFLDENKPQEKCENVDFHCLLSTPDF